MKGRCLCGAVCFTAQEAREIGACHCGFCRRWSGGPMLAVHCGPEVEFTGGEQIAVYRSSEWAERAFCKRCGTHLYYKLLPTAEYFVPAGAFESDNFELVTQLFIDKKPPYYGFANQTPMLTEADVMAQYGATGGDTT